MERRDAVLAHLRGMPAVEVARVAGVEQEVLERWRDEYLRSKLPPLNAEVAAPVGHEVRIRRDTWGIPHISAASEHDAFFALGYAMAQDRLWQLDYQRRLVRGELAEIFGPRQLPSDRTMRILGIALAGDRAWSTATEHVRRVLEALADGINSWTEAVGERLPVEFEILGYQPRPWHPTDSIAIWKHRWWLLTGRLESIVVAEAGRRVLPVELLEELLSCELADVTIVPERSVDLGRGGDYAEGSNNWVVGGARTTTGKPVLCSDPHNQFFAPSQWFEAQLTCPEFDAAGAFYIGTPALYLGRNRHVAWGLTNHTASVRDLYVEEVRPDNPGEYRDGDTWRPFELERQLISVDGVPDEELVIHRTVRGPIVNELLPRLGDQAEPPLSLRWYGAEAPSGFEASLGLLHARSAGDVLQALGDWPCPPLNYVYADDAGRFGYHAAGRVPIRKRGDTFFRQASHPDDAWTGFVPFDQLPQAADPHRGWIATANNVPWHRDPWYVSLGNWSDGYRAQRIHDRLSMKETYTPADVAAIQADVYSVRARDLVPVLLQIVGEGEGEEQREAIRALRDWNYEYSLDSAAPSIWSMFWLTWCEEIARARFPAALVPHALNEVGLIARRLLTGPPLAWFPDSEPSVGDHVSGVFQESLRRLEAIAGPNVAEWRWGRLHQVEHPHPMGNLPGLRALYNVGPYPTTGGPTVRAAGYLASEPFTCVSGSTYRFLADLSRPDGLIAVQTAGQSAHAGSPHYRDQAPLWLANEYHPFWMAEADVLANLEGETVMRPVHLVTL